MSNYSAGFVRRATAPSSPDTNDVWHDTTNDLWKRWDGTAWRILGASDPFGWGLVTTMDPALGIQNVSIQTANRATAYRVIGGGTVSKLGIRVNAQSGNISLSIYRANGAGRATGDLTQLVTTGAVACPAAGYQELSLGASYTVYPGDWFAWSADNTTATICGASNGVITGNLWLGRSAYMNTAHPCPTTFNTTAGVAMHGSPLIVGVP